MQSPSRPAGSSIVDPAASPIDATPSPLGSDGGISLLHDLPTSSTRRLLVRRWRRLARH
jgi:hypothetical protein